jgi:hypothetical protein
MKRNYILIVLFVCAIAISALISALTSKDALYSLEQNQTPLAEEWLGIGRDTIGRILRDTKYNQAFALNHRTEAENLEFLIFDSRTQQIERRYRDSCAFLGYRKVILCDVAFIDHFLAARDLNKERVPFEGDMPIDAIATLRPLSAERLRSQRQLLLTWVLGHEVGHLVAGHGAAHFGPDKLDDNIAPRSISQARELEADSFLASTFVAKVNDTDSDLYFFLIQLLQNEINRKACPDISPLQYCKNIQVGAGILEPTAVMPYLIKGSHPEYIVRLLRLIDLAHQKYDMGIIGYINRQIIDSYIKAES